MNDDEYARSRWTWGAINVSARMRVGGGSCRDFAMVGIVLVDAVAGTSRPGYGIGEGRQNSLR